VARARRGNSGAQRGCSEPWSTIAQDHDISRRPLQRGACPRRAWA
jgi:hypothetical protein